jgi:hypothetical protein
MAVVLFLAGSRTFLFTVFRPVLEPTKPPIQWILWFPSPGVKQLGHEADYSFPSSAQVKNAWSYILTPPYIFMKGCLVQHRIHLYGVVLS